MFCQETPDFDKLMNSVLLLNLAPGFRVGSHQRLKNIPGYLLGPPHPTGLGDASEPTICFSKGHRVRQNVVAGSHLADTYP